MDILLLISNFVRLSREKRRLLKGWRGGVDFVCLLSFLLLFWDLAIGLGEGVRYETNIESAFFLILDFKEPSPPGLHVARPSLNYVV